MYTVPALNYSYDAFGPYISKTIMELHHDRHHQAYVDKLNAALAKVPELEGKPLLELLSDLDSVPAEIRGQVRNQGGGHYNHSLFWKVMSPDGGGQPSGKLAAALTEKYGNFQKFTEVFETEAMAVFGSGWVWLQPDLTIAKTANQDSPLMTGGAASLLGLDVWEHAYYLDYTYKRVDYVKAWWNVVDWRSTANRFEVPPDDTLLIR